MAECNSDGDTVEAIARPCAPRPRLLKSERSQSLRPVALVNSVDEDEECENAEQSEERRKAPVPTLNLEKIPSTRISSYMPGGTAALVSPALSRRIRIALADSVTVLTRQIGSLKLECFSGANVVNCLLRLKFADNRQEATTLACRVYSDGVLRALQPGGFVDHVEHVYRFQDSVALQVPEHESESAEDQVQLEHPHPFKIVRHDKVLFSIAAIVGGRNEDWLNNSFGFINAEELDSRNDDTLQETSEGDESAC